ncbi:adenylate/guanylate cyclase domain-containing protein [Elusimicrobiota bacterium]
MISTDKKYDKIVREQIKAIFDSIILYVVLFSLLCGTTLVIINSIGMAHDLTVPAMWTFGIALYTIFLYKVVKKGPLSESKKYTIVLSYVSMPTMLYVISCFVNPSRAAAYITGPTTYIYFIIIILSGFFLDSKLSIISGIVAGAGYFIMSLLAHKYLLSISTPYKILLQSIVSIHFYFFKSLMMVFAGISVGIFLTHMKKLITKIIQSEKEKVLLDKQFGQFVSKAVKDRIISEKKGIIGETKEVVVLFSDLRAFSAYCENYSSEETILLLNEYFDNMVNIINENGGMVDKFMGDAIMAVFGGLIGLVNPCDSALKTALEMKENLVELNVKCYKDSRMQLNSGIGIHYGKVLQGIIGSANRKEFTVIGDTVNIASRLEQLTKSKEHKTILSESVYDRLSPELKDIAADLGTVQLKGMKNKIHIFGVE